MSGLKEEEILKLFDAPPNILVAFSWGFGAKGLPPAELEVDVNAPDPDGAPKRLA